MKKIQLFLLAFLFASSVHAEQLSCNDLNLVIAGVVGYKIAVQEEGYIRTGSSEDKELEGVVDELIAIYQSENDKKLKKLVKTLDAAWTGENWRTFHSTLGQISTRLSSLYKRDCSQYIKPKASAAAPNKGNTAKQQCVKAWNHLLAHSSTLKVKTLLARDCPVLYRQGWKVDTNDAKNRAVIPECRAAWTELKGIPNGLKATETLIRNNCPILNSLFEKS